MIRFVIAVLLFSASVTLLGNAVGQDEPKSKPLVPTIKEIMNEAHKCHTAYITEVRKELAKDEPDWYVVEAKSRDLIRAGKLLALNTPPNGPRESWEKMTTLYVARATILVDAAERKDKEEASLEATRMTRMCSTCHRAHR